MPETGAPTSDGTTTTTTTATDGTSNAAAGSDSGGLPPSKSLLDRHNHILARVKRRTREEELGLRKPLDEQLKWQSAARPQKPGAAAAVSPRSGASNASSTSTARSRWDDAPVEECMAYISKPHTTWAAAAKGMDISDVCPNWRRPRSECPPSVRDDRSARGSLCSSPRGSVDGGVPPASVVSSSAAASATSSTRGPRLAKNHRSPQRSPDFTVSGASGVPLAAAAQSPCGSAASSSSAAGGGTTPSRAGLAGKLRRGSSLTGLPSRASGASVGSPGGRSGVARVKVR